VKHERTERIVEQIRVIDGGSAHLTRSGALPPTHNPFGEA